MRVLCCGGHAELVSAAVIHRWGAMTVFTDAADIRALVAELIREGNVRRITLKRDGRTLVTIPLNAGLTVGAVTALVAPFLLGVGALAAVLTKVTIVVERPPEPI